VLRDVRNCGGNVGAIADAAREALQPYVGATVADTCVRATAISLGKSADELGSSDLGDLESHIRHLLEPVAPRAAIDGVVLEIRRAARTGG
jgi:hypothetical protein